MSNQNYALARDGVIENVALVDDETDDGRAFLDVMRDTYDEVVKVDSASPGQRIENGVPVPLEEPEPGPQP